MLVGGLLATGQQARAQVSLSYNGTLLSNSVTITFTKDPNAGSSNWYWAYTGDELPGNPNFHDNNRICRKGGDDEIYDNDGTIDNTLKLDLTPNTRTTIETYLASSCLQFFGTIAQLVLDVPSVSLSIVGDSVTHESLSLSINRSGNWYYKYTTPSGGQCSNAVSGTTAVASGLQSSTSYAFKAYSDSGCATELATAAATSTAAPLVTLTPPSAVPQPPA